MIGLGLQLPTNACCGQCLLDFEFVRLHSGLVIPSEIDWRSGLQDTALLSQGIVRCQRNLLLFEGYVEGANKKAAFGDEQGTGFPTPEPKRGGKHLRPSECISKFVDNKPYHISSDLQRLDNTPFNGGVARVEAAVVLEALVVAEPNGCKLRILDQE